MTTGDPPLNHSWLASDRRIARLIARPMRRFLDTEAAGGIVLLVATCAALLWANSPVGASYGSFWSTEIAIDEPSMSCYAHREVASSYPKTFATGSTMG